MQIQPNADTNLELDILEHIHVAQTDVHQRDLANIISKSLGMTNSILKRLTEKGLLTVAKVNNRNISYAVTPAGMRELAKRSYRYVKRTIRNVVFFKDAIDAELLAYKQGCSDPALGLLLIGHSDVDFIIEHLAVKHGYIFRQVADLTILSEEMAEGKLLFLAEDIDVKLFDAEYRASSVCLGAVVVSIASLFEGVAQQ